ncbi:aspartic peptidase domain-containing protein [Corynascus novoguineensis]|uniref:Aspartic peptidase domain-containing protein n=1 Tax=Corynascus novoguineensis TaxID=1126955 RepID=A0AAN7D0F7_9PEZI|nr:aspartic peptidase domain-containing protein [Corynascus novoguineensis]
MDSLFETHAKLRKRMALFKVKAAPNEKYKRDGTKSYVSVMNRFGFQPTKPGPYFQKFVASVDGGGATNRPAAPGVKPGHVWKGLFKKLENQEQPEEVTAQDQQNDTEYICEVQIGTAWTAERQVVKLDFDTGSADLWVSHKSFDPRKSVTWQLAEGKSWRVQYGDGSSASGIIGTDILIIGGIQIKEQAIEIATEMSPQFSEGTMDGILGLGFRKLNTVQSNGIPDPQRTVVDNMIAQDNIPSEAELFTSALYSNREKDRRSFYTFGWIDEDLVKKSGEEIAWTDVDNSEGFWMFSSEHVTINGQRIWIEGNKAIADTGVALALISDQVCDALYAQIPGATYSDKYQGWTFPRSIEVDNLPDFKVAIGDKEFVLQKEDLIFAPACAGLFYGGVQSRGENPFDILGNAFLRSIYAIWDQGNGRFGAVPKLEAFVPPTEYEMAMTDKTPPKEIPCYYGDISSTFFSSAR